MPTVAEVLKAAGMTDEQIQGLDAKAVTGFTSVLTAAEQERQQAELAQRSATQMFEEQITPALNAWGNKEAALSAERDYYKTLAEKAKDGGFIAEVPPFKSGTAVPPQQRNEQGQYAANGNAVPGSPDFREFESRVSGAMGTLADVQWKYRKLFGVEMPDSPTSLAAEASQQRMSMSDYVAKKYGFAERETAVANEAKTKHEDAIRKEERESRDKYWAERSGTNPMVRESQTSRFSELKKGVTDGARVDPLKMTREQRRAETTKAIQQEVAAASSAA